MRAAKCLACDRAAKIRGLCSSDYQAALRLVRLGKTTEAELISIGLILPPRERQSEFALRFSEALRRKIRKGNA